jgi:dimethylargininase
MFGRLRRVMVRAPHPDACDRWSEFGWRAKPDFARMKEEHSEFSEKLRSNGTEVIASSSVPSDPDAIYVYDPAIVCDDGAILLSPGKEGRRPEAELMASDLSSIGVPVKARVEWPGTVEGGDTLWLDERTLIVGLSFRTNEEGLRSLRHALPGATVSGFDIPHHNGPGEVLHLMSLISPLDADLAVVFLPLLPSRLVETLNKREVRLIEVPEDEFATMGSNVSCDGAAGRARFGR